MGQHSRTEHELLVEYRATGDLAVRDELVSRMWRIVDRCSRQFAGRGEPLDDLRQVAAIGLIKAIDRFDPDRGVVFETFARPTIIGEIKRHFRDRTWRVTVPRQLKELRTPVTQSVEVLSQRLGRAPTVEEIADRLGIEPGLVNQTIVANRSYRMAPSAASAEHADSSASNRSTNAVDADLHLGVLDALRTLDLRDREIIYWRFFEQCTQSEIGSMLGVSQVHVSRLMREALRVLRSSCLADFVATRAPDAGE